MSGLLLEFIHGGQTVSVRFPTGSSLRRYVRQRGLTLYTISEVD